MAKFQSPLLGYNNNVRHRGRVFHIQTEDSGVNHPHIITHLFMDGGRILKSVKRSYAEHVGTDGMADTVRSLMKDQHKAMFVALRDGQFDDQIDVPAKKPSGAMPRVGANRSSPPGIKTSSGEMEAPATQPDPPVSAPKSTPKTKTAPVRLSRPHEDAGAPSKTPPAKAPKTVPPAAAKAAPQAKAAPAPKAPPPAAATAPPPEAQRRMTAPYGHAAEPPLPPELEALLRDELPPPPTTPTPTDAEPATTRESRSERRHKSVQELTLDFDALAHDSGSILHAPDLPPPPKQLFAKEPRTAPYRAIDDMPSSEAKKPASETKRQSRKPPANKESGARRSSNRPAAQSGTKAAEGRYPPARPAAIFGAAVGSGGYAPREREEPKPASVSIFSDELVSDKSLDEVILSYLAEDLDPPRRK